jgi:prephenate dehydrogenase
MYRVLWLLCRCRGKAYDTVAELDTTWRATRCVRACWRKHDAVCDAVFADAKLRGTQARERCGSQAE